MEQRRTPNLSEIANDFALDPLTEEVPEAPDPRSEVGDSRGARFRRTVRSLVMADLAAQAAGKAN